MPLEGGERSPLLARAGAAWSWEAGAQSGPPAGGQDPDTGPSRELGLGRSPVTPRALKARPLGGPRTESTSHAPDQPVGGRESHGSGGGGVAVI